MSLNPSLQKKSAARMAAAQCLYRGVMNDTKAPPVASQVTALKAQLKNNRNEQKLLVGAPIEPNYTLLEAILSGVDEWKEKIDERLNTTLTDEWTRERMSPLLIAILQCAIFELFFHKDNKPGIIIDEYTRLTRSFLEDGDVNFVYGALSGLSKQYHG
ncbi:MAG: transcription antitermination factor NusB [Rickettsiales bacterium]